MSHLFASGTPALSTVRHPYTLMHSCKPKLTSSHVCIHETESSGTRKKTVYVLCFHIMQFTCTWSHGLAPDIIIEAIQSHETISQNREVEVTRLGQRNRYWHHNCAAMNRVRYSWLVCQKTCRREQKHRHNWFVLAVQSKQSQTLIDWKLQIRAQAFSSWLYHYHCSAIMTKSCIHWTCMWYRRCTPKIKRFHREFTTADHKHVLTSCDWKDVHSYRVFDGAEAIVGSHHSIHHWVLSIHQRRLRRLVSQRPHDQEKRLCGLSL